MTMTVLDRAPVAGDAGGVTGERPERPDPEVPERARRRTFTAQYKLEVLAAYDAAGPGEKGAMLRREGLYSSHIVEWRRARDPGRWRARRGRAAVRPLTRGTRRSPGCARRRPSWSRSWPRPASWWMSSQNCRRSWRRSPRARTPSPGRVRDRRGDRRCWRRGSAPGRPARPQACRRPPGTGGTGSARRRRGRSRSRTPSGSSRGRWPRPSGRRSWMRCTATGSLTWPRTKSGRRCWTRAPTSGRCPPITGCCARPARAVSGARRPPTPPPSSPSWWPPGRTRCAPGTSPSCTARRNGPTTTCT